MGWKKLLDTKELISYERALDKAKVSIEARLKNGVWFVYKTYNILDGDEWNTDSREYIARTKDEASILISELKHEEIDISKKRPGTLVLDMKRIYKEDFIEKWKFRIDDFNYDNFVIVRYDTEISLDIILHDRYNSLEKDILERIIMSLGLKGLASRIRYDFFYYKKHSAKRRIYDANKEDKSRIATVEFTLDPGA